MKKTFVIILTLIGILSFGQENKLDRIDYELNLIEPTELDSLYVRALNNRFDLTLASGWNYVEMTGYGKRISDLNVSDRFKFLTNEELINLSIKEKKTINIIRLNHKIIAKDTIDIVFGNVSLTAKRGIFFHSGIKFKKAEFSVGCRGTNGYQPDVRFVYHVKQKKWNILTNRFISSQKNESKDFRELERKLFGKWTFEKAVNEEGNEVKLFVLNKPLKVSIISSNINLKKDFTYFKNLPIDKESNEFGTWEIVSTDQIEFTKDTISEINAYRIVSLTANRMVLKSNENYFYQYIKTAE